MKYLGTLTIFVLTLLVLAASAYAAGNTPLHDAIIQCDKAKIEALIASGADVNAKGRGDWRPLQIAASQCKLDIAELLVAKGADINANDNENGWSSLHRASANSNSNVDVIAFLLAKGADINKKGKYQSTPLHAAAGTTNKEIVALLLAHGADFNSMDVNGNTPLNIAVSRSTIFASLHMSNEEVVKLLENHFLLQAKNPREVLGLLIQQLQNKSNDSTRRLILKLASGLKPQPAIPEEARKHFIEGSAIVKAGKNPAQQALAAQSFTEALKLAPWWGDAYYNLGVAQELAEKYDEAEQAFNFYLLSNPGAAERREGQDRIYALSAKRKLLGVK